MISVQMSTPSSVVSGVMMPARVWSARLIWICSLERLCRIRWR